MASPNAKQVAKDVSEHIRTGKKINLGKIIRKNGYSRETSLKPKLVTETKTFKKETLPIVEAMERERQRIIEAMNDRNLSTVQYRDLSHGLDTLTKNAQLLSGKETQRSLVTIDGDFKKEIDTTLEEIL